MAELMNLPDTYLEVGTRLHPSVETTDAGMGAFGKPVPFHRRDAALQHARSMGCTNTDRLMYYINRAAQHIERDEPYRAMEELSRIVDLTGNYRLLAVLCAGEPTASNGPPIDAVDWDAVAKREIEGV